MKIGIDAKWFFSGPPSGRVVVQNLIHELLQIKNPNHKFYIFLNNTDKHRRFPYVDARINTVYIPRANNLISNVFIVPYYCKKLGLDTMLFQNFGTVFKLRKSIVYIHDILFLDYPQFYSLKERLYLRPIKFLAKMTDVVVTISNSEKQRILKHKLGHKKNTHFVYHGISNDFKPISEINPEELFAVKETYKLPDRFVLFLGRLNIRKNIKNLLVAMKNVDATLVIVGAKNHKTEDLSHVIEEAGLKQKVIFTGHISDAQLPTIYSLATIFCFPSYAEGFGLPPLEAMASGVAVVSSDRTSLKEVCRDAAIYIDPEHPNDIAEKINILLNSPSKRNELVKKGIARAQQFKWKNSAEELMQIIEGKA